MLRDVIAGVVVGIVALPLALAFAIASGVPPERGLYTAIIAGFLISALGGSRVQIGGPTGAFVVIVYGIVQQFGYEGLVICTVLAGAILVVLGLARMGALIKYIPYPVITGFTAGIAVIIFSSQMKDFFGLKMGAVPADFMEKWVAYAGNFGSIDPATAFLAVGTLAVLLIWPRISRVIPGPFVAMILATLVVQLFDLPVETIGSRFGGVPSSLPRPHWPDIPVARTAPAPTRTFPAPVQLAPARVRPAAARVRPAPAPPAARPPPGIPQPGIPRPGVPPPVRRGALLRPTDARRPRSRRRG